MKDQSQIQAWYEENSFRLLNRGLWFQGKEPNTQSLGEIPGAKLKVLIARLSGYHEVATGITHSYLHQMALTVDGLFADFAFMPPAKDEKLFIKNSIPFLTGTTSKLPPSAFDAIVISNSVLQELLNLPAMLHYSDIPLSHEQRNDNDSPLIIIGGSNAYNLSVLFGKVGLGPGSGLVDGVLLGDGEFVFARMLQLLKDNKSLSRTERIALLRKKIAGFYDPLSYKQVYDDGHLAKIEASSNVPFPVKANKVDSFENSPFFTKGPILYDADSAGSSHVLVSNGCPSFCSFCKESWEQKPYRERSVDAILNDALELKKNMGLSEIALMSFNANTYSGIFELLYKLESHFDRVAIKSQRFDAIVNMPELLDRQIQAGKKTFTCAMEGISNRIRILLQKNLSSEVLYEGFNKLFQKGIRQLKVFLILTGFEQDGDIAEFRDFLKKIKLQLANKRSKPKITFSFATLFRPPHTPLQFAERRKGIEELLADQNMLCDEIKKNGFEARISASPFDAFVSEFIAYSDRRSTSILVKSSIGKGLRYRGEVSKETYEFWAAEFKKEKLGLLINKPDKDASTAFPWDDIDTGISKDFLFKTYKDLLEGNEKKSCISAPWGGGKCIGCNACNDNQQRERVTSVGPKNVILQKQKANKAIKYRVKVYIPETMAYCEENFLKAVVAKSLMSEFPELVRSFKKVANITPRIFAYGVLLADFEVFPEFKGSLKLSNDYEETDQFQLLKVGVGRKDLETDVFPAKAEVCFGESCFFESYSRNIDELLKRYKIKHQKQWQGELLTWKVNQGQAKKTGISYLGLSKENRKLFIEFLKWPEIHIINKLTEKGKLKLVAFNDSKIIL